MIRIGLTPDIEAEMDQALVSQGKDPLLEKAIETVMADLKRSPLPRPKRPAYHDYHKYDASGLP